MRSILVPAFFLSLISAGGAQNIPTINPGTGFGANAPDIVGISFDTSAADAEKTLAKHFAGVKNTTTNHQRWDFRPTGAKYVAMLIQEQQVRTEADFKLPIRQDLIRIEYSGLPSGNRAHFMTRNLQFNDHSEPSLADFVKQIVGKYGTPTEAGNHTIYYFYRKGQVVALSNKSGDAIVSSIYTNSSPELWKQFRPCAQLEGQGQAPYPDASILNSCDAALMIRFYKGTTAERVNLVKFTMIDLKRLLAGRRIDQEVEKNLIDQKNRSAPTGNVPKL